MGSNGQLVVPTAYEAGYRRALEVDAPLAENYIAHTAIGDPVMDRIVEDLSSLPQDEVHGFIRACMEGDRDAIKGAPDSLREFFFDSPPPEPPWLDYSAFDPGIRAFQRNVAEILPAFVAAVLIDGFATLISKSFVQTGRIFDNGVWRLKQNNRHMMEIFWTGGLGRYGDGWKLSVRIRFVHAQVRRLLAQSEEWKGDAWGVPISAAHLGYSVACFAARTVRHSESLGARYSKEERAGFHAVWRYSGHLMGIPDSILFTEESDALDLYRIGKLCEPPPTTEAILMTNALINSAPLVAGITDTDERSKMVHKLIYPISRALIGPKLADQLNFPRSNALHILFWYRMAQRVRRLQALWGKKPQSTFGAMLEASAYDDAGLSYRLPDHVHAERASKW